MASSSSSSPEMTAATSAEPQESHFSYKHATHEEVLEDLSSRFILNLPDEELASLERICFQVEQAHWFYEDFIREQNPNFPSLPLKKFSAMLFQACPLLHQWSHDHEQAFNTFMHYKTRVPVCGAIMLNDTWEKCLLVKGWKSSSGWGFPKGKINEDEPPPTCAIREVLEETGYNLAGKINPKDVIQMSIREQKISLFIVPGVPEDFPFKTKTRKEISKIEWFKLCDLPTWKRSKASPGKFYLISPFIGALKAFINEQKPRGIRKKVKTTSPYHSPNESAQESSSQSSSADNGDPQTPSPQYSAPTVNPVSHVTEFKSDASTESMDPHFARLLSSLTLSASASMKGTDDENAKQSTTSASTVVIQEPMSPTRARNRHLMRSYSPRKSSMDVKFMSPLAEISHSSVAADDAKFPQPSASSTMRSPHATSRQTSSTADISPYLSRPLDLPTSAKQLKQIALLESVVDESAKLVTTIMHHNSTLPVAMDGSRPVLVSPPPSLPVPSNRPPHVLYNHSPALLHQRSPLLGAPATTNVSSYSSLPVRSMTSHALFRGPMQTHMSSMNITQSHSLDVMGASNVTPEPFVQSYGPMYTAVSTTNSGSMIPPQMQFGPLLPPRQFTRVTPTPTRFPPPTHSASTNSLLSILNKTTQGHTTTFTGSLI
ncbi:hypothetical protein AX15_006998 [Amanita polypyramis BW_CC]|nr:hypothetical protein AX15_006998 [Amanita polypyramis BW_CC]